ncbi:long-chain fatty acid--CoA ligase, partial [bacterium]|nr:long-chain fatty acid--CoA ligase [bacterium]
MPMDGPSQELLEKITKARSIDGSSGSALPYRNIGEMLLARADRYEDLPFLIYYGEEAPRKEFSFRDIYEQAGRTANYLRSVGIRRGDRIAVVSANHPDTVTEYFAAFMTGAVAVPVNPGEDDRRIQYMLQNSGARLAFVRDMSPERIAAIAGSGFLTIARTGHQVDDESPHAGREIAKQSATYAPDEAPDSDDDALIVYTSGATGKAKGVVLTQRNLLVEAMSIAAWHQLADDQRMMCVLPLYHVNGIVVTLLTPLLAGAGVVLNQQFRSGRFFERASAERVSVVSVVPTLLKFLLSARIDLEGYKLAQFRHVICGAGPLSAELAQKFEQTFKIPVIHGYGLSETTSY